MLHYDAYKLATDIPSSWTIVHFMSTVGPCLCLSTANQIMSDCVLIGDIVYDFHRRSRCNCRSRSWLRISIQC